MKSNGNHMKNITILSGVVILLCLLPIITTAGNRWMMERNGRQLLMVNERLIGELDGLTENGEIEVQGRVVIREGKLLLQLDKVKQFTSTLEKKPADPSIEKRKYKVYLREDSLPEIPVQNKSRQ